MLYPGQPFSPPGSEHLFVADSPLQKDLACLLKPCCVGKVSGVSSAQCASCPRGGEQGPPQGAAYARCHPVFTPEQALMKWNGWTSVVLHCLSSDEGRRGQGRAGCRLPCAFFLRSDMRGWLLR